MYLKRCNSHQVVRGLTPPVHYACLHTRLSKVLVAAPYHELYFPKYYHLERQLILLKETTKTLVSALGLGPDLHLMEGTAVIALARHHCAFRKGSFPPSSQTLPHAHQEESAHARDLMEARKVKDDVSRCPQLLLSPVRQDPHIALLADES